MSSYSMGACKLVLMSICHLSFCGIITCFLCTLDSLSACLPDCLYVRVCLCLCVWVCESVYDFYEFVIRFPIWKEWPVVIVDWCLLSDPALSVPCPFEEAYYFNYNDHQSGLCGQPISYAKPCVGHTKYLLHFKHCVDSATWNGKGERRTRLSSSVSDRLSVCLSA